MIEEHFLPPKGLQYPESGTICWKAPSNIALVKYWGKKEHQIPANPSISFTLDACTTTTKLTYQKKDSKLKEYHFDFFLDGKPKDTFKPKIETFFQRIDSYLPFLKTYHFKIETSNSFPHSSGIASSASGMAALALCLLSIEKEANAALNTFRFNNKASFLARLGSGSACRSISGALVQWGKTPSIDESSNLFGIAYPFEIHNNFKNYHDTILLVHKGEKQVSSTVGHQLMQGHPYAKRRFVQAHENLEQLQTIFLEGDLDGFMQVVESEALTLHAMMMTSKPYFMLMKPGTLQIIHKIWKYREATKNHVCFTLDAGANVHVLYPEKEKVPIIKFIQQELVMHCEHGHYICDRVGTGAKPL